MILKFPSNKSSQMRCFEKWKCVDLDLPEYFDDVDK